jgi:alpha-D-ribose 1-methylphosphonate 5-triphosphate diphosphatase
MPDTTPNAQVFAGRIVLANEIIDGHVVIEDGVITAIDTDIRPATAIDLGDDLLIPGLIELHTDHLENHLKPRPKVDWPVLSALMAFDAQIAVSGITTVFDCLRAGHDIDYSPLDNEIIEVVDTIASTRDRGVLRADHRIHIRCEICAPDVIAHVTHLAERTKIELMSLMDHTPGARQFTNIDAWRTYYGGKSGRSQRELDELIERKYAQFEQNYERHRAALVEMAHAKGITLASHDDALSEHVAESITDRVALAEFPTTLEAARLSHEAGIRVMMGAPNVVRGGSHSGNIASEDLACAGYLDALSSDYVPASLLFGAFELTRRIDRFDLPQAIRTVSLNPAAAAGLEDRGEIAIGKRADLVRVAVTEENFPIVREVYRRGQRIL